MPSSGCVGSGWMAELMKATFGFTMLFLAVVAQASLPHISVHPNSQIVPPSSNVVFSVVSTNATAYQWRFNGTNLAWGTGASLVVTNAQTNDAGYYMVIAKNETGWMPSPMAYLSVVWSNGVLPMYNTGVAGAQAVYALSTVFCAGHTGIPITNGQAQLFAGPELDQMRPAGAPEEVNNGFFGVPGVIRSALNVNPGQTCYYRVDITYNLPCFASLSFTQLSTTIKLVAGGEEIPVPSPDTLQYPFYGDWPEMPPNLATVSPSPLIMIAGEDVKYRAAFGSRMPNTCVRQWRKDGTFISDATESVCPNISSNIFSMTTLQFTDVQPSDAGVYDFYGDGNVPPGNKLTSWMLNKIPFGVWLTNSESVLRSPRVIGGRFVCDLEGVPSRKYDVLMSSDLIHWSTLTTLSNASGSVTFSNSISGSGSRFFSARLLPLFPP